MDGAQAERGLDSERDVPEGVPEVERANTRLEGAIVVAQGVSGVGQAAQHPPQASAIAELLGQRFGRLEMTQDADLPPRGA